MTMSRSSNSRYSLRDRRNARALSPRPARLGCASPAPAAEDRDTEVGQVNTSGNRFRRQVLSRGHRVSAAQAASGRPFGRWLLQTRRFKPEHVPQSATVCWRPARYDGMINEAAFAPTPSVSESTSATPRPAQRPSASRSLVARSPRSARNVPEYSSHPTAHTNCRALLFAAKFGAAHDRRISGGRPICDALRAPAPDVGTRWIVHGIVIANGTLFNRLQLLSNVKGRPSAIAALHAEQPIQRTALDSGCCFVSVALACRSASNTIAVSSSQDSIIGAFEGPPDGSNSAVSTTSRLCAGSLSSAAVCRTSHRLLVATPGLRLNSPGRKCRWPCP